MANGDLRMMRLAAAASAFTLWLAIPAHADSISNLKVDGQANIFSAGRGYTVTAGDGQGGVLPTEVTLTNPASLDRGFMFSGVEGKASWRGGGETAGSADGETGVVTLQGLDRISGITAPRGLTGVFLDDQPSKGIPEFPESLNFGSGNGAIPADFTSLNPKIGQLFFIGDGKNSNGATQQFYAPNGATKLFLGFADGSEDGKPGFYGDNTGEITLGLQSGLIAPAPVPEPATLLAWGAVALTALAVRARRRS